MKEAAVSARIEESLVKAEDDRACEVEKELREHEKVVAGLALKLPVAVITVKLKKGFSPFRVQFYGDKSYALLGKIVSYCWDFGDGDTSVKKNPINTYLSATYGVKPYKAILTVKDDRGNTGTTSIIIEVTTK